MKFKLSVENWKSFAINFHKEKRKILIKNVRHKDYLRINCFNLDATMPLFASKIGVNLCGESSQLIIIEG